MLSDHLPANQSVASNMDTLKSAVSPFAGDFFGQGIGYLWRNEGSYIPAHASYLPDQCRGNVANIGRCRHKHALDRRRHFAVHASHLHFIVQVASIPESPQQGNCAVLAGSIHRQAGKGHDLEDAAAGAGNFLRRGIYQGRFFFDRKHRRLARMRANSHQNAIKHGRCIAQHIQVAIGDWVKRAGIERCPRGFLIHSGSLTAASTRNQRKITDPVSAVLSRQVGGNGIHIIEHMVRPRAEQTFVQNAAGMASTDETKRFHTCPSGSSHTGHGILNH